MDKKNNIGSFTAKSILNLPRKWYSNHFWYELRTLNSFINLCSEEIDQSKIKYLYEKETIELKYCEEHTEIIEVYKEIDDQTFDLDYTFTTYFPDLKRKSNFTMIISTLEAGLLELCNDLGKEFSIKFNRNYRKGLLNDVKDFLKFDLKISFDIENDIHWKNLVLAYRIRNKIVHITDKNIPSIELESFNISNDFIFGRDSNSILLEEIHSFLKNLELELLKI